MKNTLVKLLALILFVQFQTAASYATTYTDENHLVDGFAQQQTQDEDSRYDHLSDAEYEKMIEAQESGYDIAIDWVNLSPVLTPEQIENETSQQQVLDIDGSGVEVPELQKAAIGLVKNRGHWAFQFLYINKADGSVKVLSQSNIHDVVKPASTLKIFTGWLAFLNESYPQKSLSVMLHKSDNQMADAALRSVAQKKGFSENPMTNGLKIMKSSYVGLEDGNKFDPKNGSGLNNYANDSYEDWNKVTVRLETHLLHRIYKSGKYSQFKKLLAQPGQFGTLKRRLGATNNLGRVYAKTGTLAKTKALAGYVDTKKGVLIFSIIGDKLQVSTSSAMVNIDTIVYKHAKYLTGRGL